MTDIVQHPTKETQRAAIPAGDTDKSNYVVVTDNVPIKVYVKQDPLTKRPIFAGDPDGQYFTGGIWWDSQSNSDTALFITFVMTPPVSGIECELPYSVAYGDDSSLLDLCLSAASEAKVTYQFFVNFSDGSPPHDPKIVVTPIESPTDNLRAGKA